MKRAIKLKIIAVVAVACSGILALFAIIAILLLASDDGKNALAGSVYESPERIEELMRLKKWGVPIDLVMMATTYQCETPEEALEKPLIFNALDFMFMTEVVKEYIHDDDEEGECTSRCGYKTIAINYYWHRSAIKSYLGIYNEESSDLNASNLEAKAQAAADALCAASGADQIRIISFNAIPSERYGYALELCGVEREDDREGMLHLHEAGYFIDWLEEQAAQLGIDAGEGPATAGGNRVHSTIVIMTANDDSSFVGEDFISPIYSNWQDYVTCEINGYPGHTGIDLGVAIGTPVHAVASGTVILAGSSPSGYGNYCVINHGGKITTLYAHNSKLLVHEGQTVEQGQIIAYSGNSGNVIPRPTPENPTAGAHLHFEVIVSGVPHNPRSYLP